MPKVKVRTYYLCDELRSVPNPGAYTLTVRPGLLRRILDRLVAFPWFPLRPAFSTEVNTKRLDLDMTTVAGLIRAQYEMLMARGVRPTTALLGLDAMERLRLESPGRPVVLDLPDFCGLRLVLIPHMDGVVVY